MDGEKKGRGSRVRNAREVIWGDGLLLPALGLGTRISVPVIPTPGGAGEGNRQGVCFCKPAVSQAMQARSNLTC